MLNASIRDIPIPARMARRPVSDRGFPVPWFVAEVNGQWDFRVIAPGRIAQAYHRKLCWLCGEPLGQYLCFVIGPMCSVNRVSSEPPSHRDCAEYAVRACPFLSQPRMRRNDKDLPTEGGMAGIALEHNPGATLIWVTKSYRPISDHRGGVLFNVGEPLEVCWYCEGRTATRDDILAAFDKGLPTLRAMAVEDGPEAEHALEKLLTRAMTLLPKAMVNNEERADTPPNAA